MLGNRLEQDILEIFDRDCSVLLSINQISKKLHKSYPHINAKVNNLIKEGVLSKANVGRSYLCSLNLENEKSVALMILEGAKKKERILSQINNREVFLEELAGIKEEFNVESIVLCNNSLIFVMEHLYDREAIKNMYKAIKQFDLLFFDKESFVNYILENPDSIPETCILYSYEKYFSFVSKAKEKLIARKLLLENKKSYRKNRDNGQ